MDLTLLYLLLWALLLLISGYFMPSVKPLRNARILAWSAVLATVVFSEQITLSESPLYRMGAIVCLLLLAMKSIVLVEAYPQGNKLNVVQWSAFAVAWFGMRPALFENFWSNPLSQIGALVLKALSRIVLGWLLLYLGYRLKQAGLSNFYLNDLPTLIGLSLILHFGILNLATAFWRSVGVNVTELFRAPYRAMSLKEFWGKRWNLAFSEMTALVAYRPIKRYFSPSLAVFLSFLLSGLLHEIAISFPVRAGYGLPLFYFVLHGGLMYAEEKVAWVKRITLNPVHARIWVMTWLILPMPILFHPHFLVEVVQPLSQCFLFFL